MKEWKISNLDVSRSTILHSSILLKERLINMNIMTWQMESSNIDRAKFWKSKNGEKNIISEFQITAVNNKD